MKPLTIELLNVKISETLSEETTAYTADLYINGSKIAYCSNSGKGEETSIRPYGNGPFVKMLSKAVDYCLLLPPVEHYMPGGELMKLKMSLPFYCDTEVYKIQVKKDAEKNRLRLKKLCFFNICAGSEVKYSAYRLSKPVSEYVKTYSGRKYLQTIMLKIAVKMKPGEKILNENIPAYLLPDFFPL